MRLRHLLLLSAAACPAAHAETGELVRRFGQLSVAVALDHAQPGGIAVVRFRSARWLGQTFAVFEGRRAPVFFAGGTARALVPIPAGTPPGPGLLGIELSARTGLQRLRLEFPIGERSFGERSQTLPDDKRALLQHPDRLRDGRRLMLALRTLTNDAQPKGPVRAPVAPPPLDTFGEHETYVGGSPVEMMMDGGFGDRHRGLDYAVALGNLVQAPAAGTVVMAEPLLLTGETLVLDHGQGLVSLLCHLSRLDVKPGDRVAAGDRVGLAGDTGLAMFPHVHWATYLYGIPVDPAVVMKLFE